MTKSEIITYLVNTGYIFEKGEDDYIISNKILREITSTKVVIPMMDSSALLSEFIKKSKIPFEIKMSSGAKFQPAVKSEYAKKFLYNQVYLEKKYTFDDMTKATEIYYNDNSRGRVALTNYFKHGIFESVMEEFLAGRLSSTSNVSKNNRTSL